MLINRIQLFPAWLALLAGLGTWLVTALGAATVFLFRGDKRKILNMLLGFAAGVMIAASFWSLLAPAIERAENTLDIPAWLAVTTGFVGGALFIWLSDKAVTLARGKVASDASAVKTEGDRSMRHIGMLILSITLHNIPEGLAVGVAFGALNGQSYGTEELLAAISVAVGIGLQNYPEGAAVSLPLRREGFSAAKSFFMGQASGLVEPISALIGALLVAQTEHLLPYALSFAAGAMVLVAVHELIPECQSDRETAPYFSTMGIIAGFSVMMLLDVALG